jgi:tetratricopeptide (TPR) repeat protein
MAYRLTLYPQIVEAQIELGEYKNALGTLQNWENDAHDNDFGTIWLRKGDVFTTLGNLNEALKHFEKAQPFFEKNHDKVNLAVCLERLGSTHAALGNLDKALQFYEDETALFEQLYESYPSNVGFKNGLAISYSKLGSTHAALGNLDKALQFYEERSELGKQLYESYPSNVGFKNGLAISYANLGVFNRDNAKDSEKARFYFKNAEKLWLELVRDAPQYVQFQKFLKMVQDILNDLT